VKSKRGKITLFIWPELLLKNCKFDFSKIICVVEYVDFKNILCYIDDVEIGYMKKYSEAEVEKLQDNLELIRQAGGWTAEEFGEMIGVTKQTIRNLETHNRDCKMSLTQYIAIRSVLDYEIKNNPDNELLAKSVKMLLDSDGLPASEKEKVQDAALYVASARKAGRDSKMILSNVYAILGLTLGGMLAASISDEWLDKLLKK